MTSVHVTSRFVPLHTGSVAIGELQSGWDGFCRMWYQVARKWRSDVEFSRYVSDTFGGLMGPGDVLW